MSERLTIDELARVTGMTVRNVRAHQTRGLLPPPEIEGRTGFYGPRHVARLRLIKEMRASGFNLGAIKNLLDAAPPGSEEEVLRFERALLAPWGPEEPEIFERSELIAMFDDPTPEIIERARDLGLVVPLDGDRVEVPMPTLLRAGRDIAAMGVGADQLLDVLENLLRHARGVSRAFIELFLEGVWRPFEQRGEPVEEWPKVRAALERLRAIASEALGAAFQTTMKVAVEEAFGREMERRSGEDERAAV